MTENKLSDNMKKIHLHTIEAFIQTMPGQGEWFETALRDKLTTFLNQPTEHPESIAESIRDSLHNAEWEEEDWIMGHFVRWLFQRNLTILGGK